MSQDILTGINLSPFFSLVIEFALGLTISFGWIYLMRFLKRWSRQNRPWRHFRILAQHQGLQQKEISYLLYLAQVNAVQSPIRLLTDADRFAVLIHLSVACENHIQMDLMQSIQKKLFRRQSRPDFSRSITPSDPGKELILDYPTTRFGYIK